MDASETTLAPDGGPRPFPGFCGLSYRQIASACGRDINLEHLPAVYAWYRCLSIQEVDTEDAFIAEIDALLGARLSPHVAGRVGYLYHVSLEERAGALGVRAQSTLRKLATNHSARTRLASILSAATPLQAPLYVGKARDLHRRVSQHLNGVNSELLEQLRSAGIQLRDCRLVYRYVPASEFGELTSAEVSDDDVCYLVEELLTRLSPAAFVRHPGK